MLFARVMSNNVVTVCFLELVIAEVAAGVAELSSENASSRSFRLKVVDKNASLHTVDATFDASTLFQKKGLSRFVGRTTLGFPNFKALGGGGGPGGGGMPGGRGGGEGAPDTGGSGGGGGGGGGGVCDSVEPLRLGGGGDGCGERKPFPFVGRAGGGGGGGGGGGNAWVLEIAF